MMSIHIRRFEPADANEVVAMWHATKRAAFPYVAVQQQYTTEDDDHYFRTVVTPRADIWLALVEGQLAGFMALDGDLIDLLFVDLRVQRSGVGTALLQKARQLRPDRLRAYTFQKNMPAISFFEKHGFGLVRLGISPPPENEPDAEYAWQPPSAPEDEAEAAA